MNRQQIENELTDVARMLNGLAVTRAWSDDEIREHYPRKLELANGMLAELGEMIAVRERSELQKVDPFESKIETEGVNGNAKVC